MMQIHPGGLPSRSGSLQDSPVATPWLSDDMARALAAMSPPLSTTDVLEVAGTLTGDFAPAPSIDQLLRHGADLMTVRRVIEALRALRDARVTDSGLAGWLLMQEAGPGADSQRLAAATERVLQKLGPGRARVATPSGNQALLSRALHVVRAAFPFLEGVRAGAAPDACLQGLGERILDVDPAEVANGLQALLGVLFDMVVGLIGEDLTIGVVRGAWPDLPPLKATHSLSFRPPGG
jgi:hypothetical protein